MDCVGSLNNGDVHIRQFLLTQMSFLGKYGITSLRETLPLLDDDERCRRDLHFTRTFVLSRLLPKNWTYGPKDHGQAEVSLDFRDAHAVATGKLVECGNCRRKIHRPLSRLSIDRTQRHKSAYDDQPLQVVSSNPACALSDMCRHA